MMTHPDFSDAETITHSEGYDLEVNDVAELLGVTRTRVSQLTSNGQLSFERRRVGSRSRLFYKKSEVLLHQKGYYGRHAAAGQSNSPVTGTIEHSKITAGEPRIGATAEGSKPQFVDSRLEIESNLTKQIDERTSKQGRMLEKAIGLLSRLETIQNQSQLKRSWVSATADAAELARTDTLQSIIAHVQNLSQQLHDQQNVLVQLIEDSRSIKTELRKVLVQQEKAATNFRKLAHPRQNNDWQKTEGSSAADLMNMPTLSAENGNIRRKPTKSSRARVGSRRRIFSR
jgi:hypothetical protein